VGIEFPVRLQIDVGLHLADRKNETDLWADTDDARFEWAQLWSATPVGRDLLIEVTDCSDENLFGQEL